MLCHNYSPHPGGLEVMVQQLCLRLARRHEVVLVTSSWDGARGKSHESGLEIHRLPMVHVTEDLGVPYPVPLGPGSLAAIRALRSVDLLHAHGALYTTSILGAALSRARSRPLVLTEHVGFVEYKKQVLNSVQRAAWKVIGDRVVKTSAVVATYNTRVQKWLGDRFPGKAVRYVGNGVAVETFRPRDAEERAALRRSFGLPQDELLLLTAARASEKKNVESVLRIPRRGFHLVVCGWRRGLQEERLTDLGVVPHERMADLFGCVDMMVHAAEGEGLPLAVQEALSCGVPLALLWDEGYSGWISQDAVLSCPTLPALVQGIAELATSADRRRELSSRARQWAQERWSWDATVSAYEQLYFEVLQRKAAHA